MIKATINKILKSFDNLPKEYKNALYRILIGLVDGIKALDELKVDKEDGKELSSNDFTDELKNKLDGIEEGAQKNVKSDWNATEGDALILNKPTFTEYPNAAEWDHINHKIIFKHDDTELPDMEIDGADFVKDGMIENIEIVDGNLVVTFNTDHGLDPISIPLSKIFNPENYYTKEDINHKFYTKEQSDNKYVEKVPGKQLSTEDFTTAFKEKLENIKSNTQIITIYNTENYSNATNSLKEFINNITYEIAHEFNFLFLLHVNAIGRDNIYRTFKNGNFVCIPNTIVNSEDVNYKYVEFGCSMYGEAYEQKANYESTKLYDRGLGFIGTTFRINIRYNDNVVEYKTIILKGTWYGDARLDGFRYYYDYPHIKALLGEITSYTNEQIEQLIAEGNQVKVFKLNIAEDKTLLQQILTDNPEDGNVDITSVMYFVYDSTKQKYYDINGITIETVESDRQINITAAIGRYDYTAVKINTNEAAYIINPSHVESANGDWNENDEDKSSYVKNRTHWTDDNNVVHQLDSKYLEDLTDEEINEILE